MNKLLICIVVFLSNGAFAMDGQDSLSGYPGYRIFSVDQERDRIVVGKTENTLYGTPRNNGSPEVAFPTSGYLQTNRYELVRLTDLALSLEQLERVYNRYPKGHVTVYCYFMPDGQLEEIYFGFQRYEGRIPFTNEELGRLQFFISREIRGWYRFPENYEEQVLQKQKYIDVPMNIPIELIIKYMKGIIGYEEIYTWGGI